MKRSLKSLPPRPQRLATEEEAALTLECGAMKAISIRNVSAAGFMAECRDFVRIGSTVAVARDGDVERRATVRWAMRGRFGARFEGQDPATSC